MSTRKETTAATFCHHKIWLNEENRAHSVKTEIMPLQMTLAGRMSAGDKQVCELDRCLSGDFGSDLGAPICTGRHSEPQFSWLQGDDDDD